MQKIEVKSSGLLTWRNSGDGSGNTVSIAPDNSTVVETNAVPLGRLRLESVDILRGVIMIFMALDHTRDFFGITGFSPTDPAQTTISLFFTRWIQSPTELSPHRFHVVSQARWITDRFRRTKRKR